MTEETFKKAAEIKEKIKQIEKDRETLGKLIEKELVFEIHEKGKVICNELFVSDDKELVLKMVEFIERKMIAEKVNLEQQFKHLY